MHSSGLVTDSCQGRRSNLRSASDGKGAVLGIEHMLDSLAWRTRLPRLNSNWICCLASESLLCPLFLIDIRSLRGGNSGHFADYLSLGTWSYWSCVLVANCTLLLHAQAHPSFRIQLLIGSSVVSQGSSCCKWQSQVWMDWQILVSLLSVMFFPCLSSNDTFPLCLGHQDQLHFRK